ncbi:MAG: hypothetical protein K0Q60_4435 [Microvirga sp.]|jgi:hypothetical protein|nr:hypothetical protein [Microvirga sp.]
MRLAFEAMEQQAVSTDHSHLNQIELARRWKLSPRTLERWRWLGQGPRFMKLGGRVAYRLEDVEAFEAEQLRQITPRSHKGAPLGGRGD